MTRYEHTQIGHVIIWSVIAMLLVLNGGLIGQRALPLTASIILLVCLVLFYRLKITIDDKTCAHQLESVLSARKCGFRRLSDVSQFAFAGGMAGAFI